MGVPTAIFGDVSGTAPGYEHGTQLATLLFTDMVGSTALKQNLGDRPSAAVFARHHATLRQVLRRFPGGREIETAGDSFLIVFSTPSEAVQFSLTLQRSLEQLRNEFGVALADRIGIHVGEVVLTERSAPGSPRDLYGIQIDTCARIMSLAAGGQILMTRFAFDNARQVLRGQDVAGAGSVEWLNHGPYLLKGVDEPVEICEVRRDGQTPATAPPSTEKARRMADPREESILGWRPAIGQSVPRTQWFLECKLGEGGFGEVWLGEHHKLRERRVFKFCFRADRVRALKREMTLLRVLRERAGEHPRLVRILEVNLEAPPFYLEEEYIPGRDLRVWCEARGGVGRVPMEVKLEVLAQVADALQVAHEAGVIHRDVKPGNILIAEEKFHRTDVERKDQSAALHAKHETGDSKALSVKLSDFGIGQVVSQECLAGFTGAGFTATMVGSGSTSASGTHLYMAPELLAGRPASVQSDLYSLGVVLFQLLVSDFCRPVTIDWERDVADALLKEDLRRCLAGRPEERFQCARELAEHLRSVPERRAAQAVAAKAAFERGSTRIPSIAVLPFVNMSSDQENEYLSDGITEDLCTALSQVKGLRVPARSSCFFFKGKAEDVRKIGQQLDVAAVLEGSVRKVGNRLRISAQLISAADGFLLWATHYDREMNDLLALQSEIAQQLVTALRGELQSGPDPQSARKPAVHPEAHRLTLLGRFFWNQRTGDGLRKAASYLNQALAQDPDHAPAHAALADCYLLLPEYSGASAKELLPKARAAARRALALNPSCGEAHAALGYVHRLEWDWAGAEAHFKQALELSPNYPTAHHWYALLLRGLGRFEEATCAIQRARALDPLSSVIIFFAGALLSSRGCYDQALSEFRNALDLNPNFAPARQGLGRAWIMKGQWANALHELETLRTLVGNSPYGLADLGYVYAVAGRTDDARRVLEELKRRLQNGEELFYDIALVYHGLGERDQALHWLEQTLEFSPAEPTDLQCEPLWESLRSEPRFVALLRRMGLGPANLTPERGG